MPGDTPYKGNRKCFGLFHCDPCSRQWSSGNSWAYSGQECNSCFQMVYPYRQSKLQGSRKKKKDKEKKHPMELCERCKELGEYCGIKSARKKPEYDGEANPGPNSRRRRRRRRRNRNNGQDPRVPEGTAPDSVQSHANVNELTELVTNLNLGPR